MMKARTHLFRLRSLLLPAFVLGAFSSNAEAQQLERRVAEHILDNGMKLILMERPVAPVVSAVIQYKVGSVDDVEGKTGLAHLYEHLAFRGTEIVGTRDYEREQRIRTRIDSLLTVRRNLGQTDSGDGAASFESIDSGIEGLKTELEEIVIVEELDQIYNLNGAVGLNATTSADLTTFIVDLPANRLPLWAVLESDRMAHSAVRGFEAESKIVAREQQSRMEDDPEGRLYREYLAAAFQVHPYRRPVTGWNGDMDSVTLDEATEYYRAYYSPGNAVVALVGDFDVEEVIALAETTFGNIPARALPARSVPPEPRQVEKKVITLEFDAEPALFMGFHKGSIRDPEDPVFEVLIEILTRGSSARLHRSLFIDKRMAMDFASWIGPGDRYPNLFTIAARPIHPHTGPEVEEAIWEELRRLATEPVTEEELQRARNRLAADFLRQLQSRRGMTRLLAYYESVMEDWSYLEHRLGLIEAIGPEEVRACAARHFVPENCTVAFLRSVEGGGDE